MLSKTPGLAALKMIGAEPVELLLLLLLLLLLPFPPPVLLLLRLQAGTERLSSVQLKQKLPPVSSW